VVATKIPGWGEFVLAEFTQTFEHPDVSYFKPLMGLVELRLGRKPSFGAFAACFCSGQYILTGCLIRKYYSPISLASRCPV